ncbi:unnamed protein product [Rangifer tarandus platyrhynchus]|uniref:Uncharacterized protein n=2 Tax=Rangifer tarandus platyrhynchus TaxID=3082113 RepID=A0ABN8ZQX6_RANTA|nr:unnamed protein product [Rangifer tarandus platyrhynchus]CAI9709283.1 unnamed protein product [Rangifer tarandus platyrhynchus]
MTAAGRGGCGVGRPGVWTSSGARQGPRGCHGLRAPGFARVSARQENPARDRRRRPSGRRSGRSGLGRRAARARPLLPCGPAIRAPGPTPSRPDPAPALQRTRRRCFFACALQKPMKSK